MTPPQQPQGEGNPDSGTVAEIIDTPGEGSIPNQNEPDILKVESTDDNDNGKTQRKHHRGWKPSRMFRRKKKVKETTERPNLDDGVVIPVPGTAPVEQGGSEISETESENADVDKTVTRSRLQKTLAKFRGKPKLATLPETAESAETILATERRNNANGIVDFTLTALSEFLTRGSGQIPLPVGEIEFDRRAMGINFRGHANFHSGKILGLENIHRVGDAVVFDATDDGSTTFSFDVELRSVEVKYAFGLLLNNRETEGNVSGRLQSLRMHFKFKMSEHGDLSIENLGITNAGMFGVHTSGLGALNPLVSGVGTAVGNLSKRQLLESVDEELQKFKDEANRAIRETTTKDQKEQMKLVVNALMDPGRSAEQTESLRAPLMEALTDIQEEIQRKQQQPVPDRSLEDADI